MAAGLTSMEYGQKSYSIVQGEVVQVWDKPLISEALKMISSDQAIELSGSENYSQVEVACIWENRSE